MDSISVKSSKDKVTVTFDKNILNLDILIKFIERLEIEEKAKKISFSPEVIQIAEEIKNQWWQKNKVKFLK